jgi:hypothetical protein
MGLEQTVQPRVSRTDIQGEVPHFYGDVEEAPQTVADAVSNVQLKITDRVRSTVAEDANDSPLLSIAAVLMGDRLTFIDTLSRTVEQEITPSIFRRFRHTAQSASDEAATFARLAVIAIGGTRPPVATAICVALAARTAGLFAQSANGAADAGNATELLTAWLETARAMSAARGLDGLRRLLPTARLLARKSAERGDSGIEIAATMHRIAARIVAESSLERVFDLGAAQREPDSTEQGMVGSHCTVSQSPMELIVHPR